MPKLRTLKIDADTGCHTCRHQLGTCSIDVYLDASEETVAVERLTEIAQIISDDWASRHPRLATHVADELASNGYLDNPSHLDPCDCVPFYLRVYADLDSEISYTIAFNAPSILEDGDEYVEVEEEISGKWLNTEVCSTE